MKIEPTTIEGCFTVQGPLFKDDRGGFFKSFSSDIFVGLGLATDFKESYYSVSHKGVARGLHFQVPPHDHEKLVYVSQGLIEDFILDIRQDSKTYGQYISLRLDAEQGKMVYIPKGCAHGFLTLEDNSIVNYLQTSVYHNESDKGVALDLISELSGKDLILSDRDKTFPELKDYQSPF